jgi:serine/threonine-protein kinase
MSEFDPDTLVLHIDAICDRFEAAWREGRRPRIEDYLSPEPGTELDSLVRELVLVDIHYRRQAGETLQAADYVQRFPNLDAAWLDTQAMSSIDWQPSLPGYEILRELGRGGMGIVYWAWQSGARRLVAVKMMLAGDYGSPQQRARFRIEAEAVGRLQHTNIVSIYEVGEEGNRPYLSMEYVGGGSLADKLAGTPLPARAAAELVETLARAMDYAHQRGIVHRDLTPTNVLLTTEGVPKISDFGLAKLTVGGGDMRTQTGSVLGTPSYMAPEQAEGRTGDIGPSTDVYALGAILYEMLTGRPPFRAATPLETLQQVRGQEPVSLRRLQPKVPLDLETICLKCLSKEPPKRYATAKELADDVRRYLQEEPIQARRTSLPERAWRWCRRNPAVAGLLLTVGVVLLTAVVGLAIGLVVLDEEQRRTEQRRKEAVAERVRADANAKAAAEQRSLALETLKNVVFDIQAELKHRPAMQPFRKKMLEKAAEGLQRVARSAETAAQVDHSMASAHIELGDIFLLLGEGAAKARGHYETAERIAQALTEHDPAHSLGQRDLTLAYQGLGKASLELGDLSAAEAAIGKSLTIAKRRARFDPANIEAQRDLVRSWTDVGDLNENLGHTAVARDAYTNAVMLSQNLARECPGPLMQRQLGLSYSRLGNVLEKQGDFKAARNAFVEAQSIVKNLAQADPGSDQVQRDLFISCKRLGDVSLALGDVQAARKAFEEALQVGKARAHADPSNIDIQRDLSTAYVRLGKISQRLADAPAVRESFREAVTIMKEVTRADPANAQSRLGLGNCYMWLGDASLQQGDVQAAREAFDRAVAIGLELTRVAPPISDAEHHLCDAYDSIAGLSLKAGDIGAAREAYGKAIAIAEKRARSDPTSAQVKQDVAELYSSSGALEKQALRFEAALGWYERARVILRQLERDGKLQQPDLAKLAGDIAKSMAICKAAPRAIDDLNFALAQPRLAPELFAIRATALARQGRPAEAAMTADKLRDLDPKNPENLYQAARCYTLCLVAALHQKPERASIAEKELPERYATAAMQSLRKAIQHGYKDVAQVKLNKDLDPLRSRDDFKEILAGLESKAKPRGN